MSKAFSWGRTLLWGGGGGRAAESASVGVHVGSLIISQALLRAAQPHGSTRRAWESGERGRAVTFVITTLVEQHVGSFSLKYKGGGSPFTGNTRTVPTLSSPFYTKLMVAPAYNPSKGKRAWERRVFFVFVFASLGFRVKPFLKKKNQSETGCGYTHL